MNASSGEKLPIEAVARFNYMNLGKRATRKVHDEWFTEGYITSNTTVDLNLYYDYTGYTATVTKEIDGDTTLATIFSSLTEAPLGDAPLGQEKLAGGGSGEGLNKFRIIHEMPPVNYYEIQPEYTSNGVDQRWEVLAYGGNLGMANNDNNDIKK